ncbi:MAG: MFS transporter [Candidatus Hydrogenedens sp.]|nr:MFS transporter [Candidatus Hydrogenedens sp.]
MSVIVSTNHNKIESTCTDYIEKNKTLFVIDATLAQGMLNLTTGAFLSAYALYLGASYVAIGILGALMPLSQILQVPSTLLIERYQKRKTIAVFALTISRIAILLCGFLPFIFTNNHIFSLFFLLYLTYVTAGNIGGCAFGTWFRDSFNPDTFYHVLTQRFIYATLMGAIVSFIGAFGLEFIKHNFSSYLSFGYASIFTFAGVLGLGSSIALFNIYDFNKPSFHTLINTSSQQTLISLFREPIKNKVFLKVMIFCVIWNTIVNFANPFLPVFLMKKIGYSLLIVVCLTVINQFSNVVSFSFWRKFSLRYGYRSLLYFCVPLFFSTVFLWFLGAELRNPQLQWYVILILHILSGASVAGINLCLTNLIFLSSPQGKATAHLALNSSLNGLVAGITPILAGLVASFGKITDIPMKPTFNIFQPIVMLFNNQIEITGLDLVMIITGIIGIFSAIAIRYLIPNYLPELEVSTPKE